MIAFTVGYSRSSNYGEQWLPLRVEATEESHRHRNLLPFLFFNGGGIEVKDSWFKERVV